jgi:hypothetical protein
MEKWLTRPVWIVISVLLLLLALLLGTHMQHRQVDWLRNYEGDSRDPFGITLLRAQWPTLFPGAVIREVPQTAFDQLVYRQQQRCTYVFINDKVPFYAESTRELLRFVQAGNAVFIAAHALPPELGQVLGVASSGLGQADLLQGLGEEKGDSLTLSIQGGPRYRFPYKDAGRFYAIVAGSQADVLGRDAEGQADFLRIPYGQGTFWLYSHPNLLGNYYLLDASRRPYLASLLSQLPATDTVFWDEYYKVANLRFRPDSREDDRDFGEDPPRPDLLPYLFSQPALALALSLAIAGLLLYTGSEIKRKQRVIPDLAPLPNTTLAFTRTIGRLYFQHGDHANLARKRIRVLLDHIRHAYFLSTQVANDDFIRTLAGKSGLDPVELKALFEVIDRVQPADHISEDALIDLHRRIDWFYRSGAR